MAEPESHRAPKPSATDRSRTPLLTLLTQDALDEAYAAAAQRRTGSPRPPGGGARLRVPIVIAVFALLVTVAAVQTSRNAADDDASRSALIDRIEARKVRVQELQGTIESLRAANTSAQQALLTLGDRAASVEARRSRLSAYAGFESVVGPGLRVTVNLPDGIDDTTRIHDTDLVYLVDALWAVGAEAIAINGHRLTARSAIRNSGTPIEVNDIGIAPPYVVTAIGNVDRMASDLIESGPGQDFLAVAAQWGFAYEIDSVVELRLPAAPQGLSRLPSAEILDAEKSPDREDGTP